MRNRIIFMYKGKAANLLTAIKREANNMNDEQILTYCKNVVLSNLKQYMDENPATIGNAIYEIQSDKTNKTLAAHLKGLNELITKGINILENNGQQ